MAVEIVGFDRVLSDHRLDYNGNKINKVYTKRAGVKYNVEVRALNRINVPGKNNHKNKI